MGNSVVVLKDYQMTNEVGNHHRLLCMSGPKKGEVYYLKSKRITLGRDNKCDIRIEDSKSSRVHAELVKIRDEYVYTDLKSNNGSIINGKKIRQTNLKNKDRIIIGKTVLKYEQVSVEDEEDTFSIKTQDEKSEVKEEGKKKKVLYLLGLVLVIVLLLPSEEKVEKRRVRQQNNNMNDEFVRIQKDRQFKKDQKIKKQLDVIMQRGIRELREENYYRAISEFNMALILSPQNGRANAFKEKAKQGLDQDIDNFFALAARDFESLNYIRSIKSYCAIIKMLEYNPDDERRKSAEKNIKDIINKTEVDEREGRCK